MTVQILNVIFSILFAVLDDWKRCTGHKWKEAELYARLYAPIQSNPILYEEVNIYKCSNKAAFCSDTNQKTF